METGERDNPVVHKRLESGPSNFFFLQNKLFLITWALNPTLLHMKSNHCFMVLIYTKFPRKAGAMEMEECMYSVLFIALPRVVYHFEKSYH